MVRDRDNETVHLEIRVAELLDQLRNAEVFGGRARIRMQELESELAYYRDGADDLIEKNEKLGLALRNLVRTVHGVVYGEVPMRGLLAAAVIAAGTLPQPEPREPDDLEIDAKIVFWDCPEAGSYEHVLKADLGGPTVEWRTGEGGMTPVCLVCRREGETR